MKAVIACIEDLRVKLEKHRRGELKEFPTRTIFVNPMLEALGWDVKDPDEVELEHTTVDGKLVDYALKINRKPVLFVEAKPLDDRLTDVKAITQVIGYAANAGVDWCILTNGTMYRVYRSSEKAEAPDKLLFEVSLDPRDGGGRSVEELAGHFWRFSRAAMADQVLDNIGEQVFTTKKIRKALDKLFADPPNSLMRLIRSTLGDDSVRPVQIKQALARLWAQTSQVEVSESQTAPIAPDEPRPRKPSAGEYGEEDHLEGMPQETQELFWAIDKFCRELDLSAVKRKYLAKYVRYTRGDSIFCCVHVDRSGLRVWLKLSYSDLDSPPEYARDVSKIGHWGPGDVELWLDGLGALQSAKALIQESFQRNKPRR